MNKFLAANTPNQSLAITNNVFISPLTGWTAGSYIKITSPNSEKTFYFRINENIEVEKGSLALNSLSRRDMQVQLSSISSTTTTTHNLNSFMIDATLIPQETTIPVVDIFIEITKILTGPTPYQFIESDLIKMLSEQLHDDNGQILDPNRTYIFNLEMNSETTYLITAKVKFISSAAPAFALLKTIAGIDISPTLTQSIKIHRDATNFFRDFSVNDLGIGGLDQEIDYIFRRVFITRLYNKETLSKLGINHVRGMLLYGPPGTGKTLIARQLSGMLNCTSLKIVNGPEILDKFVGESEKHMRELFSAAEADKGAGLHIIIFDEIDSLCRSRGNNTTGNSDNIVNQLLTKMDGVESLNNILIIGMTNRLDLIDSALLRPGRFEVKVKINLPDFEGRKKIFTIHTQQMTESLLAATLDYDSLARATTNYTGAEISGVVRNATSYALARDVDQETMKSKGTEIQVTMNDFHKAILASDPMFGRRLNLQLVENEDYVVDPSKYKKRSNLYFIDGDDSEMVAKYIAQELNYPNVIIVNNYELVALDGYRKSDRIKTQVTESLVAERSIVIFNRVEELIDYFEFNGHFNVNVAGTIKTLINYQYTVDVVFIVVTKNSSQSIHEILGI